MSAVNTGGPAFPVQSVYIEDQQTNSQGMTLRDYFAAKAMQGMLSNPGCTLRPLSEMPSAAYEIADAMLKARTA